jgi:hypothetical protein
MPMLINDRKRRRVGTVSAVLMLIAMSGTAIATGDIPISLACADRDLVLVTLIEKHGELQDVPSDELAQAFFVVMRARAACREGSVSKAFDLYDSIAPRILESKRTAD